MSYEISSQLEKIYGFMLAELREVNIRKDMSRLDPIIRMLESMRDTWQIVAQQQRKKLVGA
jgi:flagellar protein FliS